MTQNRFTQYAYGISVLLLTLTGFGQMPIFKRYYIADIPGLGWLARFYVTHAIHYITAALFLGIIGYQAVVYLAEKRGAPLSFREFLKAGLLSGISISGFLLVIRNFPGYRFPELFITGVDLVHMGLAILLVVSGLTGLITRDRNYTAK